MMNTLPAATSLGEVHLGVADLDRSLDYYERTLGLVVRDRGPAGAELGTPERALLVLHEEPGAVPAVGHSGLFHFALLVPERVDLARFLAHAAREQLPLTGLSDHFVSEAIYLRDPDHHGIEVYADRPRSVWEGQVGERLTTEPLHTRDLLSCLADPRDEPFDGLPSGTTMGHVHLRVADVAESIAFYRDAVGFDLMAQIPSAAFLSAGGYHHHVGANSWESRGRAQPPAGTATLRHATIVLPTEDDVHHAGDAAASAGVEPQPFDGGVLVHDPSGNTWLLRAAG